MRLRVLGCSGGIGGRHLRTTSFLVDNDVLIDAGTGVGDLTLAELSQIDTIFITHSHLDHVTSIPFLVDTVGAMRSKPVIVHATRATIEFMRNHLFNWAIWPDFSEIPSAEAPFLRYQEIEVGQTVRLGARSFTGRVARAARRARRAGGDRARAARKRPTEGARGDAAGVSAEGRVAARLRRRRHAGRGRWHGRGLPAAEPRPAAPRASQGDLGRRAARARR